jgi:hypothetical protein
MKGSGDGSVARRRTRRVAAVVADARLVVVESADAANPDSIENALRLLVRWAVRAHEDRPVPTEAATGHVCVTCAPEN